MKTLRAKIPEIYHSFFPDFLDWEIPEEKIATCDDCTFCKSDRSPYINTKCCTYFPRLPNYMVGGLLLEQDPAWADGQRRIKKKISQQLGISPYGIFPPLAYTLKFKSPQRILKQETVEEINALLCPYYNNGRCSIWKYREHLCSSFFCASMGGKYGKTFWSKLYDFLKVAESELSKYAMLELGIPPELVTPVIPRGKLLKMDDPEGNFYEDRYKELWGSWLGREEEFYEESYYLVRAVDKDKFQKMLGQSYDLMYQALENCLKAFTKAVVPDYMILNPDIKIDKLENGHFELSVGKESHVVSPIYMILIRAFDGKHTTVEVYHKAYQTLLWLGNTVEDLYRKEILIKAD